MYTLTLNDHEDDANEDDAHEDDAHEDAANVDDVNEESAYLPGHMKMMQMNRCKLAYMQRDAATAKCR